MLIKSIYTHIFERTGKYFLFNSQTRFFCEISQDLYELLYNRNYSSIDGATKELLIEKKVLIEEDEKYLFYNISNAEWMRNAYTDTAINLVIAPTIQCNFNCPYCFESKEQEGIMNQETEDQLIDFIKKHESARKINLTWYGGEPLLAFNRICSIYNRLINCVNDKRIANHSLITNGWLLTDEIIDFFSKSSLSFVQITLDGTETNHNSTRCLKNGMPTFQKIYDNIIKIAKAIPDASIAVRVNVSKNNASDYTILQRKFKEENIPNISVYPGFIREDTADGNSLTFRCYSGCGYHDFYREAWNSGADVKFFPKSVRHKGCMINALFSYLIGPMGEIYKCWNDVGHKERIVGSITSCEPTNKVRFFRYLNDTTPFSDPRCRECLVFPLCSGGCGHYRYRNIYESGKFDLCSRLHDRQVLENELIMSLAEQSAT